MYLTVAGILKYDKSSGSSLSDNFVQGENLLKSRMLPYCGRMDDGFQGYKIVAYCEQDENRDKRPYEIRGFINLKGKILRMICVCDDGTSGQCKHVFASLLYCASHNLDDLHKASCKEIENMQTADFTPRPLCEYEWFKKIVRKAKKRNALEEEQENKSIKKILYGPNFETVVIKQELD